MPYSKKPRPPAERPTGQRTWPGRTTSAEIARAAIRDQLVQEAADILREREPGAVYDRDHPIFGELLKNVEPCMKCFRGIWGNRSGQGLYAHVRLGTQQFIPVDLKICDECATEAIGRRETLRALRAAGSARSPPKVNRPIGGGFSEAMAVRRTSSFRRRKPRRL